MSGRMGNLRERRDTGLAGLHRHEQGCAVRGCGKPTAFTRPVEVHGDPGPTGGLAQLIVLGYCKQHLDQIVAFKERQAAA